MSGSHRHSQYRPVSNLLHQPLWSVTNSTYVCTGSGREGSPPLDISTLLLTVSASFPPSSSILGPTDPPPNLDVAPLNDSFLLITWDRPSTLPEVTLTYLITVTNISATPPTTPQNFTTPEIFLEYEELETDCHEFLFEVSAINDAGSSQPANITESIPISES